MSENISTIVLGGGCFWCIEAGMQRLKGVVSVKSGYAGGQVTNPTYDQVCQGDTGHAEVVKVDFNENILSLESLLDVFFTVHDPTQLNRQGNDIGTQYRSVIFYTSEQQDKKIKSYIKDLEKKEIFTNPIVTELKKLEEFYPAEDYHQNYYNQNSGQSYCALVINPKLEKLKAKFKNLLK